MKAKSLNNKSVTEFLKEHAVSAISKPRNNRLNSSFMMFQDQKHWIEFETHKGYCKSFSFGTMNLQRPQSGFGPFFIVSF